MNHETNPIRLRYKSAAAFRRAVAGYYHAITRRRPKREWVDSGERTPKGKPVLEERIMTDELGESIMETIYLTPPTLPGLCLYLGLDAASWADCAAGVHGRGIQEACRRAMLRQEAYLLEMLLSQDKGTSAVLGILDRYHRPAGQEPAADPAELLRRLAMEMPVGEKLALSADEDDHDELP